MWEAIVAALTALTLLGALGALMAQFHLGVVSEHERALKFVDGKLVSLLGPGRYWHFGFPARLERVDIRKRLLTIPAQEIITKDGVSIRVSLMVQFRVSDPEKAIRATEDYTEVIYATLQHALRELVCASEADQVIEDRGSYSAQLLAASSAELEKIGVVLETVHVKDVVLPAPLKQVFAQVVNARKEGQAALEKARAEGASLRSLANSARLMGEHPNIYTLRLLQSIGESKGNTFVIGVPVAGGTIIDATQNATASGQDES